MTRKYVLLENAETNADAVKGSTVYHCSRYDYGLAKDDTRMSGEAWVSVTFDKDGDYPFFTVPQRILEAAE